MKPYAHLCQQLTRVQDFEAQEALLQAWFRTCARSDAVWALRLLDQPPIWRLGSYTPLVEFADIVPIPDMRLPLATWVEGRLARLSVRGRFRSGDLYGLRRLFLHPPHVGRGSLVRSFLCGTGMTPECMDRSLAPRGRWRVLPMAA